jgi:hypothetical protein
MKLSRRWFFGLLPGAAVAQTVMRDEGYVEGFTVCASVNGKCKPANGECPVCHTMAPPYKPTVEDMQAMFGPCAPSGGLTVCRAWTKDDLPKSREVVCSHCRVKFEQDAE